MENITVKKSKLLETLKKNREEHRAIFLEALDGYRKKAQELLEGELARLKAGKSFKLYFQVVQPVDQTKDYDRAIKMLDMDIHDDVELSEHDFQCYVLDDWQWKNQFLTSNSTYSVKAGTALAAAGGSGTD